MTTTLARRLGLLEDRQPPKPRKVVIIGEYDDEPADADFVIILVAATPENIA